MQFKTLHTIDTEYSADSIEWCPHPEYRTYFVCGTYQLESNEESLASSTICQRKGRIYLYRFAIETGELIEVHRVETAAILDMKWLPNGIECPMEPVLAVANALGQIEVFKLDENKLTTLSCLDLNPDYHDLLALSLDWNLNVSSDGIELSPKILASDSKGGVNLLEFTDAHKLHKIHSWSAHNFEAWICAFDKWNSNRVYTGGDDTFLHGYDLRTNARVFVNKSHNAGVTCLLSHPKHENILLSGSYDERLRVFDTRNMKQTLGEINLNGGIWRLKLDPLERDLILVACMYKNFSVVHLPAADLANPLLVGEYNEHESICYGADWCLNDKNNEELYMATCSFYDHKLCVTNVKE